MKSWWIVPGTQGVALELREVPAPEPKPGELLVKVRAAALNRGELMAGYGAPGGAAKPGGIECAGELVRAGGESPFAPGDRVMGRASFAFSEFALLRASDALPVPARLDWEAAAGATIAHQTAYDMLWTGGELRAGEWLLVTGASAGVGVAAVQLGKLVGAKVIGTSGSAEKLERLAALGLDLGLQNRNGGFAARILEATGGKGVDLVVNNVGGTVFAECVAVMAYKGRLATVGYVDGVVQAPIDLATLHARRLRLFGVSNKMRSAAEIGDNVRGFARDVLPSIAAGHVRPVIDRVYAFAELPEARARMESNAHLGKIVIRT
jgi:NADPH:quinone reductase